jgi:beta-lactamase regulating signal transducer with metallopeptidase domain/Flp pilus assembly protein TadD
MSLPVFLADALLKSTLLLSLAASALLLAKRLSAGARHLAGLLGLAGVLALPPISLALPRLEVPLVTVPASVLEPDTPDAPALASPRFAQAPSLDAASGQGIAAPGAAAAEPPVRVGHLGVEPSSGSEPPGRGTLLLALWAAGALTVLARFAAGTWHVSRVLARAIPVRDPGWLAAAEELRIAHGISRPIRLLHTPEVSVALTAGLARPVLLLPEEACEWTEERRRVVLLHEIAHVARRDCLGLVVTALATAVYWFHPLVWVVAARLRSETERACDDLVLAAGARASDYASELLAIMRSLRFPSEEPLSALALSEGSDLEGRLRAILEPRRRRRPPSRRATRASALLAVAVTAGLAVLQPWAPARKAEAAPRDTAGPEAEETTARAATAVPAARRTKTKATEKDKEKDKERKKESEKGIVPASRRSPRSGADWYERGMSLHREGRYAEAIGAFGHAIEAGYREGAASYNTACAYALSGDKDRAFEWLGKARDAGFDVGGYLEKDDDLDPLRSDPRMATLEKSAGGGGRERRQREAASAVERFERLSSQAHASGEALEHSARELLKLREYDRSARAFAAAAERGYRTGTSLYNAACALSLKGDKAAALDALEKGLAAGFDGPDKLEEDDDLDAIRGEPRFADLSRVARDLSLSPGDGERWLRKLESLALRSGWRSAARRYERYLGDRTYGGRAAFNLGYAELKLDEPAAARDAFLKAYAAGYRKPTTMYNVACSYARLGDKDAAFEWLFKAIDSGFEGMGVLAHDDDLKSLHGDARFAKAKQMAEGRED